MKLFFLFFLNISLVSSALTWDDCFHNKVEDVSFTTEPKRGEQTSLMIISRIPCEGFCHLEIKLGFLPILSQDIKSQMHCYNHSHAQSFIFSNEFQNTKEDEHKTVYYIPISIPKIAPFGKYDGYLKFHETNGNEIGCVQAEFYLDS